MDVGFYLFGQIYGILLISQFWTLANIIFDPRQAKRLFGFIGGGASLGGIAGGGITSLLARTVGNANLMLVSAGVLALCAVIVSAHRPAVAQHGPRRAWSRPARKRVSAAARRSRCCAGAATCRSLPR